MAGIEVRAASAVKQHKLKAGEFTLYMVTGPAGKKYVGITSQSMRARWSNHVRTAKRGGARSFLHAAIRKYGDSAFSVERIGTYQTWNDVCAAEIEHISLHGTFAPCGYNLTRGGDGRFGSEVSDETRVKLAAAGFLFRHSDESRAKIGAAHKGRRKSPEQCAKMSSSRKGLPMSELQRAKTRWKEAFGRDSRQDVDVPARENSIARNANKNLCGASGAQAF